MNEATGRRAGPGGYTALEAAAAVASDDTTYDDLLADQRARVAQWEPALNAIVGLIERRGATDAPSTGSLIAVKDSVAVAGFPRGTLGFLEGAMVDAQPRDAVVVERMLEAGMSVIARTSLPPKGSPGGMTPQTQNPRALDRVTGGSSGGSAAAVAAGLAHAAIGTDSGGSIRIPAACCGVVGLNPTVGAVPGTDINSFVYSIASTGPITSNVADARHLFRCIKGSHPSDPLTMGPRPSPRSHTEPYRVGILREVVETNLDPEVRQAWTRTIDALTAEGFITVDVSLPDMVHVSIEGPRVLGIAESTARIEDTFAAHPEMRVPDNIEQIYERARALPSTEVARTYALSQRFSADVNTMFGEVDVLVLPTLPGRVPAADDPFNEVDVIVGGVTEQRVRLLTRLVNPWNFSRVPAGTLPVARDSDGGPISMQVVGPWFSEDLVLDVMEQIETLSGGPWDTTPPPSD